MIPWKWKVTVANPPRGGGEQPDTELAVQSLLGTFAWGSNPGTATIVYVGTAPVTVGSLVTIQFGRHYFTGLCKSDVVDTAATSGSLRTLEFVDVREFLQWDWVFCAFNKPEIRNINGQRIKRYKHLYPGQYDNWGWSYTNAALTVNEIVTALLAAPTIGSPWLHNNNGNGEFNGSLLNGIAPEFDALEGKRLDAALNEMAQASGTVFGLTSSQVLPYLLVFTRKGQGNAVATPANRDAVKSGVALSGNPTRVRVVGGRNLYQAANLVLEKDWATAWEVFLDDFNFVEDIFQRGTDPNTGTRFNAIAGDTEFFRGYALAAAYAREITVRDYVALRNAETAGSGDAFIDNRKFSGRSRLDMPAMEYINTLLFRAFRPTAASLAAANLAGKDLVGRLLCRVTHDNATGVMTHYPTEPVDGNGYVIVKGFQAGDFSQIKSDQFQLDAFTAGAATWGVQGFQIDQSGEGAGYLILTNPVFVSSDLFLDVNGHKVLNLNYTLQIPAARAALVYEAEKFSWWAAAVAGSRDTVESVPGLNGEYAGSGGSYTEILYADGQTAAQKAIAIANSKLQQQYTYQSGGHRNIWDGLSDPALFGTPLSGLVDRVQFNISAQGGVMEMVDYANERQRDNFEPERELDRKTLANSLTPGQTVLRQQAEVLRATANVLKDFGRGNFGRALAQWLRGVGNDHPLTAVWTAPRGAGTIVVGTPMRKAPSAANANTVCVHPANATSGHTLFAGVTVHQNVDPAKRFHVATTGLQLVRVLGPVSANEMVGLSETATDTFLVRAGSPSVGKALQEIAGDQVVLIQVQLGSGGGAGSGLTYEGEWSPLRAYVKDNIVRVSQVPAAPVSGVNYTGLFIARTSVPIGVRPVYPETATPYWELWSLGVREINVGDNLVGSRKMLTACGDPYPY